MAASWDWILDGDNAIVVAYAVVVCSFVNYYLLCYANRYLDATVVTLYAPVQPVITIILQYFWHHTGVTVLDMVSIVLTGAALVLVSCDSTDSVDNSSVEGEDSDTCRHVDEETH